MRAWRRPIYYVQQLEGFGVHVRSYTEPFLNTESEVARDILLAAFASLAKQERLKISERTKAGLETARRKGKRLGGPSKQHLTGEIKRLATKEKMSKRAIAKKLKISRPTVYKYYPN